MEQIDEFTIYDPIIKNCKFCKTEFKIRLPGRKNEKKFCKEKCRIAYHQGELKKAKEYYQNRSSTQ